MHNLYLTLLCDNCCPYCFLTGKLKHRIEDCGPGDLLTPESARIAADFFSGEDAIGFLGGEPTLHPRFTEIVDIFLRRGFKVFLFTHGRFGEAIRTAIRERERIFLVCNVNEPSTCAPGIPERIDRNLEALRGRINALAGTVYRTGQDMGYLVDLAVRHGVKAVKLGIAAPASGGNAVIPFRERALVAESLVRLVERLGAHGILTYGECEKLPPCMLDDDQRRRLRSAGWQGSIHVSRSCRTGGNVDIAPDLMVWRCLSFPGSTGRKLDEFQSPEALRAFTRREYDHLLFDRYPLADCDHCVHALTLTCDGGCMVRKLDAPETGGDPPPR